MDFMLTFFNGHNQVLACGLLLIGSLAWLYRARFETKQRVKPDSIYHDTHPPATLVSQRELGGVFRMTSRKVQRYSMTYDLYFVAWTAVEFDYPAVTPSKLQLQELKPPPYRPFRWGKYKSVDGYFMRDKRA